MLMKIRSKTKAYVSMKKKKMQKTEKRRRNIKNSIKETETKKEKTEEDIKFLQENIKN